MGGGIERTAFTVTSTVGVPIRGELLLLTSCQKSMDRLSGESARLTEFLQAMEWERKRDLPDHRAICG